MIFPTPRNPREIALRATRTLPPAPSVLLGRGHPIARHLAADPRRNDLAEEIRARTFRADAKLETLRIALDPLPAPGQRWRRMPHLFERLANLGDLAERIRTWTSFSDPEVYDHGGLVQLFAACLDNLQRHALPVEIQEIGERLTPEQAEMILRLAEALQKTPDAWREGSAP